MKNSLYFEPAFQQFEEMDRIAKKCKLDVYVPYDNGPLSENTSEWTEDYMNRLMVALVDNFSKERVAHLKKVIRYIYEREEEQKQNQKH